MLNVCATSKCFLLVSHVTNRVSLEEMGKPNIAVLNCWLNLVDICLGDENEAQLNKCFVLLLTLCSTTNYFNSYPRLGNISLLAHVLNKFCPFLPFVSADVVLNVIIQS